MRKFSRGLGAAAVVALALIVAAFQGQEGLAKKAKAPIQAPPGPLSVAELYAATERVETAIRRVVLSNAQPPTPRRIAEDRPAKRQEIIAEFGRLFEMARPHFKFTPRAVLFDTKVLSVPPTDPTRKPLENLIKFGCVGRIGPIATAPGPNVSLEEFGDAVGFFMLRISDLTHTPSAKWSPYMFEHKEAPH